MKYSSATNGFYDPLVNQNIPTDAVEISQERYLELINGQSATMMIAADKDGYPILVPRPEPTIEQKKQFCKDEAKRLLAETDYSQYEDVDVVLVNKSEFTTYRTTVRGMMINPIPDPVWPDQPKAVWK